MQYGEEIARMIVEVNLGVKESRIQRFPTGLSHYVYDVAAEDGLSCVIRIARPERSSEFRRGIKWHKIIERVDVRLPEIIEMGVIDSHDFTVYERLPGDDIENVYSSLSNQEKKSLAEEVAEIQRRISLVDQQHFERILHWKDYLLEIVARSEREILSHGLCNPKFVGLVRKEINTEAGYFNEIRPVAFLYDLSVRNVMVLKGKVTGIIDVDDVWLGDPLLAIGRGKTILLAMGQDAEFINH